MDPHSAEPLYNAAPDPYHDAPRVVVSEEIADAIRRIGRAQVLLEDGRFVGIVRPESPADRRAREVEMFGEEAVARDEALPPGPIEGKTYTFEEIRADWQRKRREAERGGRPRQPPAGGMRRDLRPETLPPPVSR